MIPKKAHLSWKSKDILDHPSPIITNGIRNLVDLNPDWQVTISDDDEVEAYLQSSLNPIDYGLIKHCTIVEKLDVWRLLKMFNEGGLYIDVDRLYNMPMDHILEDGVKCVLPTCKDLDFSQDLMLSAPGNPLYYRTLQLNMQRRKEGQVNIYFLGAQTYMHAITEALTGQMINTDPGIEVFKGIREKLNQASFLRTYWEDIPYNTFVFRDKVVEFNHETEKRKLYADYGLRHWSGEW
jgi:mannosyltransferase OCH1-like enzyme